MSNRRIVIGDIHGHFDGMMALLDKLSPGAEDEVYFLGDLIDRGPKSAQVVDFVKNSPYQCLMGNHEQLMLNAMPEVGNNQQAWQAWLYSRSRKTMFESSIDQCHCLQSRYFTRILPPGDGPTHLSICELWRGVFRQFRCQTIAIYFNQFIIKCDQIFSPGWGNRLGGDVRTEPGPFPNSRSRHRNSPGISRQIIQAI